jgi:YfiH family protein
VLLLKARLLAGFPHGFTTRLGGVSAAPFDELNLGGLVGDDPARVAENWRRLEAATGLAFARVRQVHGARAVLANAPSGPGEEADAVLSATAGLAACVSAADCVPLLLADPAGGSVAAVHAGWRGTIGRAASAGVAALAGRGARPGDLLAALGPAIGPCCYEVSADLADRFRAELGPEAVRAGPRPRIDLWAANRIRLVEAGMRPERIEVLARCTACEPPLFFSHRRDRGRTGRQAAFIAPRRPSDGGGLP